MVYELEKIDDSVERHFSDWFRGHAEEAQQGISELQLREVIQKPIGKQELAKQDQEFGHRHEGQSGEPR